jgi:hypothetical protein
MSNNSLSKIVLIFVLIVFGHGTSCACLFFRKSLHANSIELNYGQMFYSRSFVGGINSFNNFQLGRPIQFVGLGTSGELKLSMFHNILGHFYVSGVMPQNIQLEEFGQARIGGGLMSAGLTKELIKRNRRFNLQPGIGILSGRMNIHQSKIIHLKNGFFAPKVSIQAKAIFGKTSVALQLEYAMDLSDNDWKSIQRRSGSVDNLTAFNQSGLLMQISIGWISYGQKALKIY